MYLQEVNWIESVIQSQILLNTFIYKIWTKISITGALFGRDDDIRILFEKNT
jgi:hypothetical protein